MTSSSLNSSTTVNVMGRLQRSSNKGNQALKSLTQPGGSSLEEVADGRGDALIGKRVSLMKSGLSTQDFFGRYLEDLANISREI